jgi:nitrogen-specific signal transduction histidine kinase
MTLQVITQIENKIVKIILCTDITYEMPQTDLLWSGRHGPKLYNAINISTHNGRSRRVEPTVTHWSAVFDILLLVTQTASRKSSMTHKVVQYATVSLVTKCHHEVRSPTGSLRGHLPCSLPRVLNHSLFCKPTISFNALTSWCIPE